MESLEHGQDASALADLKVVEIGCTDAIAFVGSAMAGKLFADMGAEVVKIEPPGAGAAERRLGPFRGGRQDPETSGLHLYLNTSKLGVTLNLEKPRARDLLMRLLEGADILFNATPPADNDRLGLNWRELVARFPRLIVVSLGFFGTESSGRTRRGGDLTATHLSGVGYETPFNQVTDPPNEAPLRMAGRQSDYTAGFTAAAAAMCALLARKRTGRGQHADVSQWLAMVSMMRPSIGTFTHDAPESPYYQRLLTRMKTGFPWVFPCRNGWVSFSPLTDRFWAGTKKIMGNPEWADSELFATRLDRLLNSDALEAGLVAWFMEHDKEEIFVAAQAEHIPCFPVNPPAAVAQNPQYRARGFFVEQEHPRAGRLTLPGAPCAMSRTPYRVRGPAPGLGEHNRQVYVERLGLADTELKALAADGAI